MIPFTSIGGAAGQGESGDPEARRLGLGTLSSALGEASRLGLTCLDLDGYRWACHGPERRAGSLFLVGDPTGADVMHQVFLDLQLEWAGGDGEGNLFVVGLALFGTIAPGSDDHIMEVLEAKRSARSRKVYERSSLQVTLVWPERTLVASLTGRQVVPRPLPTIDAPDATEDELAQAIGALIGADTPGEGQIGRFWEELGASLPRPGYRHPTAVIGYAAGTKPDVQCAIGTRAARWTDNAQYCPLDQTISYDAGFLAELWRESGEVAPVAVIAHEWGHHAATFMDETAFTIQSELLADCLAGLFFAHLLSGREELHSATAFGAARAFFMAGNERYGHDTWFASGEHGTPGMRSLAFGTGLLSALESGALEAPDRLAYCAGYADFAPRSFVSLGPYRLVRLPGMESQNDRGVETIRTPDGKVITYFAEQPIGDLTAEDVLRAVWRLNWGSRIEAEGEFLPFDPVHLEGDTVVAEYVLESEQGTTGARGLMAVIVPPDRQGFLMIDVYESGQPLDSPRAGSSFLEYFRVLYLLLQRLCGPGQDAVDGSPRHNPACAADL